MRCAGRALQVRPAPDMRLAILSLILLVLLLVLAARAEARLIAPDIDAVGAAPPSNAQVPLALMLQDETGAPRTPLLSVIVPQVFVMQIARSNGPDCKVRIAGWKAWLRQSFFS